MPVIHCDGQDGWCTEWSPDYYEQTVATVDGVKITRDAPVPGWRHSEADDFDLCPECLRGDPRE